MSTFDNNRATWDLLGETERKALTYIAEHQHVITPHDLGRHLGVTWQRAARIARQLRCFGLVRIESLPKQTSYVVSVHGADCLAASRPITDLEGL